MPSIDHRLPRYQRLRDAIAAEIAAQRWRPGEAIPTEAELAATHGVAVGTVRKAIDVLVADGLVERSQGRGMFVRRPNFDNSLFRFLRQHDSEGGRVVPDSRILSRQCLTAPADVAERLRLPAAAQVISLDRLRLIKDKAVLSERIWLPHDRFAALLPLEEAEIGPLLYPTYERVCSQMIASAEEVLTVANVGEPDASRLGLIPGAPVVVIERLAFGYDGHPLEWRRTQAPAATFRYKIDIR